uniref:Uncharacterized protein n=1 Tax=Panagrolaimus sp. JU765 TaxID=591449 RepID=A0AC34QKT3_9BILA
MIAIATLENGGITEEELDNLAAIRKPSSPEVEEGQITPDVNQTKPSNPTIPDLDEEEIKALLNKQRPLIPGARPKAPFKSRIRRKEQSDDEDFNPFEEIATRAPPITFQQQRVLTRDQILGVSASKPRHRVGVPHEGEMSEQGWTHPRRRKPYIDIDLTKAHIVQLPIPPE